MSMRILLIVAGVMCAACWAIALDGDQDGLVAHWTFDEGKGTVARDASGNGNHAQIHGAAFVEFDKGFALQFDGKDDYVDCGKPPSLNIEKAGTIVLWFKPQAVQGGLFSRSSGGGWADERFVLSFKDYGGERAFLYCVGDGKTYSYAHMPLPRMNAWSQAAVVVSGRRISVFRDGILVRANVVGFAPKFADFPLLLGKSQGLGPPFLKGLIDDARVYNRALPQSEIISLCKAQAAARGLGTDPFEKPRLNVAAYPLSGRLVVGIDYQLMWPVPEGTSFEVTVKRPGSTRPVSRTRVPASPTRCSIEAILDLQNEPAGALQVQVQALLTTGKRLGKTAGTSVNWPERDPMFSPKKGITWSSYVPDNIALDSELAMLSGTPAISLVTVNDIRNRIDTPLDSPEKVNLVNFSRQVRFLKSLIRKALNDPQLFPESQMELKDTFCTLTGRIVTFNPRKSFVPDDPVNGAVAFIRRPVVSLMGVRGSFYELTDKDGTFTISRFAGGAAEVEAYGIDPQNGEIILAPDRGVNGDAIYPIMFDIDWKIKRHMIVLFPCVPTDIYDLVDPRYLTKLSEVNVFDATNSTPFAYGYSIDEILQAVSQRTSDVSPYCVIFSDPGKKLKVGMASGIMGLRTLLLNSPGTESKNRAEGIGYDVDEYRRIIQSSFYAAQDMLNLNEFRVRELSKYGIVNNRLDDLHTKAKNALEEAEKARSERKWDKFAMYSRRALGIESRAYPDVKATANDVIKGIIFYMALLLPFAFFMERLTFGFGDIKKQIAGASGIFLLIYAVMRFVHPAFRISNAPEVILLAFIVLTLSAIVLSIVSSKFQEQMEKMKQKRAKVYQADVGRLSASATAFSLGISNMKRRKVRTALTCITLVLLTFTVLSFTSVKTYLQFNRISRPNKPSYEGLLIRDRVWYPLEQPALDHIESEFSEQAIVSPRAWLISRDVGKSHHIKLKVLGGSGKSVLASGALGLSPKERNVTHPEKFLIAGEWFDENDESTCILPGEMAELLEIKPQDIRNKKIRILGEEVAVKGILDSRAMKDFKDLDDERITPVDFVVMTPEKQKGMQAKTGGTKTKLETFTHLELNNVVILPYGFVRNSGGTIQSIAVCFNEGMDIKEKVESFVSRLAVTVFAGIGDKVTVYSSLAMTSFSGMSNLFIPILIASLIVLNTMMGSVYERFKEIGIYSSVGLAPVHIGALFVAESCVFAILGAIAGYLMGQVIAKVFTVFGILGGLTLNYSSLSAVSSTMVVMAVVLLSTIYPARKAAAMAVPDVTRRWVLPKPEGDIWKFEFPFTVSGREIVGLYTFFKEYFSSYEDESVGSFYTQETTLYKFRHKDEDGFTVAFKNWLAPFDLGVSQKVEMKAIPTGEYGIYEIHLEIRRLSGEVNNWERLNRRFLDIIRKQFLIWRTVSLEIKSEYIEQGEKILDIQKAVDSE